MKLVIVAALFALSFATGFTCSKNTPPEPTAAPTPAAQEQMAAPTPAAGTEAAPAEGAAPAAPAEGTAAPTPAAETK